MGYPDPNYWYGFFTHKWTLVDLSGPPPWVLAFHLYCFFYDI